MTIQKNLGLALKVPMSLLHRPVIYGEDCVPSEGPVIFVANHGYNLFSEVIILAQMLNDRGHKLHLLASPWLNKIPGFKEITSLVGIHQYSLEVARDLLRQNCFVLIYPGGAREFFKARTHKYQLSWEGREDFANLSIEEQCPVIPMAVVGSDDHMEALLTLKQVVDSPVGTAAKLLGFKGLVDKTRDIAEKLPPLISKGTGLAALPRLRVKYYIQLGGLISSAKWRGYGDNKKAVLAFQQMVATKLEADLSKMLALRLMESLGEKK